MCGVVTTERLPAVGHHKLSETTLSSAPGYIPLPRLFPYPGLGTGENRTRSATSQPGQWRPIINRPAMSAFDPYGSV